MKMDLWEFDVTCNGYTYANAFHDKKSAVSNAKAFMRKLVNKGYERVMGTVFHFIIDGDPEENPTDTYYWLFITEDHSLDNPVEEITLTV